MYCKKKGEGGGVRAKGPLFTPYIVKKKKKT